MKKVSNLEMNSMLFLLTNALFFLCGIHTFTKISMKATIFSMILSSSISYFILSIFFHISKNKTFSLKNLPKLLTLVISFILVIILNYSITRIIGFVTYNVVNSISYYLYISAFLLLSLFTVYKGFHAITRSSFIYFLTILLFTFIMVITLFPKMDFQNVLPLIDTSMQNILKSTGLYSIICLAPYFYLSFFHITLTPSKIKSLKKGFLLTQIFLIFYCLITFSILGIPITNLYPYPEVAIFKKVSLLNIIDRMESIFSLSYFLFLFIHFAFTLYGLVECIHILLPKKKKIFINLFITFFLFLMNDFYRVSIISWFICYIALLVCLCFTLKSCIQK